MTCKSCNAPTVTGWDGKPMELCQICSVKEEQKWRDGQFEDEVPTSEDGTEYFTHICKSCLTPSFQRTRKGFFGVLATQTLCEKCHRPALIPVDTPKGASLMKQIGYSES